MRCPKCGAKLEYVWMKATIVANVDGWLYENGDEEWEDTNPYNTEIQDIRYYCPVCREELKEGEWEE